MIKGSIRHNNNKSVYVNNRASKIMEQNLTILKGKITNSKILIGRKRKRLDQQEQVYQQSSKKKMGKCDHLCRVLNIRPIGNMEQQKPFDEKTVTIKVYYTKIRMKLFIL